MPQRRTRDTELCPWTQFLVITLPKKGNLQQCQNYRTISVNQQPKQIHAEDHSEQTVKPQAEQIIAEKQASFRAGRSTRQQILNLRILVEKYLQLQQDLYHVSVSYTHLRAHET